MADHSPQGEPAEKIKCGPTAATPHADPAVASSVPPSRIEADQLSPEEQMALFEKELKEKDWGHQPC